MIAQVIEELAVLFAGHVVVGTLNVDDNSQKTHRFGIHALPTLLFLKDGRVVDRIIEAVPKGEILAKLNALRACCPW